MFTYDRVVLKEDVVAFTVANLEDEFTDVKQVVSTDTQLERKMQKTFLIQLNAQVPWMPL